MPHPPRFGITFVALLSCSVLGCQMIAGLTDLKPRKSSSGATTASAGQGGAGGQGGEGGMGGQGGAASSSSSSSGAGGQGGQGGDPTPPECTVASDCDKNDTVCTDGICNPDGTCGTANKSTGTNCGQGKQCDDGGNCVEGGCLDLQKGANETDIDCGGACAKKCGNGKGCEAATDCTDGYCDLAAPNANGSNGTCKACTLDAQCGANEFCQLALGGKCVAKAGNGAVCGGPNGCTSGFCVDGVCCNTACTGACEACSSTVDDSVTSGTCGPRKDGATSRADACKPSFCDGTNTGCPTSCATDADCIKDGHCDKTLLKCALDKSYGTPCAFGNECVGAEYCVDNTCCEEMSCPVGKSCNNAMGKCL